MDTMTTRTDGRWKGATPVPVPEGIVWVTREEAAQVIGCTQRTITRWADAGRLVKYLDPLGRVVFDRESVGALARLWTPQSTMNRKPDRATVPDPVPAPRRW